MSIAFKRLTDIFIDDGKISLKIPNGLAHLHTSFGEVTDGEPLHLWRVNGMYEMAKNRPDTYIGMYVNPKSMTFVFIADYHSKSYPICYFDIFKQVVIIDDIATMIAASLKKANGDAFKKDLQKMVNQFVGKTLMNPNVSPRVPINGELITIRDAIKK